MAQGDTRFRDLIEHGREERNLEYKRSARWTNYKHEITRTALGMANIPVKGVFGASVLISIEMTGIKDRLLISWDPGRLGAFYRATVDSLSKQVSLKVEWLIGESAKIALETTAWFYERFGLSIQPEIMVEEQRKLLERRL